MRYFALGVCLSCSLLAQRSFGSEVTLPAGTAVSVKLADSIDSARDPFGKQYTASVATPVAIGDGESIPAGAQATIVLMRNNSGWITRLVRLTLKGRQLAVVSSGGTVENKATPITGPLQRIGIAHASEVTSDDRILLPPATELRFLLMGSATPVRPPKSAHMRDAGRADRLAERSIAHQSASGAQEESGIKYLCSAKDKPDRTLPSSYYLADVFETSDDPVLVEKHWYEFLVATYPYMFANNSHAIVRCARLDDSVAEVDARNQVETESRSEKAQIVQTRWRYTLGPPPEPAP